MIINIDYIPKIEKVNITSNPYNKILWRGFYTFLCDFLPSTIISYSEISISFAWRYFLAMRNVVAQYAKAHVGEIKIKLTDSAKQALKKATATDYFSSISAKKITEEEVTKILVSHGFKRQLTDNQRTNLSKIATLSGAATFSVPGAGKTTEALAYFFINSNPDDRLLVVAPKNAFGAWEEQLAACMGEDYPYTFVRLRGGEVTIQNLLRSQPKFMIITYDQLTRIKGTIVAMLSDERIFMFLDESHRIKGGMQAKRAEAILELAHLPKRKMIMSGTPMPQSPKDIVSQFTFLYPTKGNDEKNVIDLIQPIYVRTTKGQLGIPDVERKVTTVRMSPLQRQIYDSLKSEMKRQINPVLDDTSKYALRRIGKCVMLVMQFVSNPSLLSNNMSYIFDHRVGQLLLTTDGPKIEYVCKKARKLVSEGKKVIIWSSFVQNVELIALRLSDLGAEYIHGGVDAGDEDEFDTREGKIKRFHEDLSCMVLVANPAACSEGISLHQVCQNAIYLDRSFNAAHYMQSEDRIHRLGLPRNAHPQVEFVECEDSIDQVIRARLTHKVDLMAAALNDKSLNVAPTEIYYDDPDEDDIENMSVDDAKAVIDYFFGGV
ncbi:MAG: hypothetical protein BWX78_01127 [Firmicutes bacterium ADurb.Bin099]|nr:MAG: hypothetical protein BWX78_01127 [Firmicutes bacterium ADurb.Bin099]